MTHLANPTIALFSSIKQRIMAKKTDKFIELATLQEHSENVSKPVLSMLMRLGYITCIPLCESGTRIYLLSAGKNQVNASLMDIKSTIISEGLGLGSIYSKSHGVKVITDIAYEAGELAGSIAAENILERDHVVMEAVQTCGNPFDCLNNTNSYNQWNQAWMAGWNKGYEAARQTLSVASDYVGQTVNHPWNKTEEKEQPQPDFNQNDTFYWSWGDEELEKNRPLTVAETNVIFDGEVVQEGFFGDLLKTAAKEWIADKIENSGENVFGQTIAKGLGAKFREIGKAVGKLNPCLPTAIKNAAINSASSFGGKPNAQVLSKIVGKKAVFSNKAILISATNSIVLRISESKAKALAEAEKAKFKAQQQQRQDAANARLSPDTLRTLEFKLSVIKQEINKWPLTDLNDSAKLDKLIKRQLGKEGSASTARVSWMLEKITPEIEARKKQLQAKPTGAETTAKSTDTKTASKNEKPPVAGKIAPAAVTVKDSKQYADIDNLLILAESLILEAEAPTANDEAAKASADMSSDTKTDTPDAKTQPAAPAQSTTAQQPAAAEKPAEEFVDIGITGCFETIQDANIGAVVKQRVVVYILPPAELNVYPAIVNQLAGTITEDITGSPLAADIVDAKFKDGQEIKPLTPAIESAVKPDAAYFEQQFKAFLMSPKQKKVSR